MANTKTIVCMLSCQHQLEDDRIYWKEAVSLQKAGYQVVHIGMGSHKVDRISAEGIRLIQLVKKKYFSNRILNKLFTALARKKDFTIDLLDAAKGIGATFYHFHDLQINRIGAALKNLPQRPIVVYDVHESYGDFIRDLSSLFLKPFNYLYSLYIERWELSCARQYDAVITTEPYVWEKFRKNIPGKPCEIIYNYSSFSAAVRDDENEVKIYDAIYSGSISEKRGIYEIIAAVRILKRSKPMIKVLIIGFAAEHRLQKRIQTIIEKYQLADTIILHPPVPFKEIEAFYRASSIGLCIVHPIHLHKNAVFIKIFEYMAFGLPVIGSNFGTLEKYIRDTTAGITVNPLSPNDIASAINRILDNTSLYKKYSDNGIKAVKESYNWTKEETKLLALYGSLLNGHKI